MTARYEAARKALDEAKRAIADTGDKATCRWCEQPFQEVKPWQLYCCDRCAQDWHLHQRKLARQEKLFDKLIDRETGMNGHGTPEERKEAKKTLDQIVEKCRNEQQPKLIRRRV